MRTSSKEPELEAHVRPVQLPQLKQSKTDRPGLVRVECGANSFHNLGNVVDRSVYEGWELDTHC